MCIYISIYRSIDPSIYLVISYQDTQRGQAIPTLRSCRYLVELGPRQLGLPVSYQEEIQRGRKHPGVTALARRVWKERAFESDRLAQPPDVLFPLVLFPEPWQRVSSQPFSLVSPTRPYRRNFRITNLIPPELFHVIDVTHYNSVLAKWGRI